MSWFEAKDHCESGGGKVFFVKNKKKYFLKDGKLVEIDSEEENKALAKEIKRRGYLKRSVNFWIGLSEIHKYTNTQIHKYTNT